jgi:hypothetical protein
VCQDHHSDHPKSSPFFFPPVHFLAPHANVTALVHHRNKLWFLFIRLGSSRDFPASSSIDFPLSCYMRAAARASTSTWLDIIHTFSWGDCTASEHRSCVSGRPLGTIVGIIRSNLRHLSRCFLLRVHLGVLEHEICRNLNCYET